MDETLADNADPLVVRDKHVFIRGPVQKFTVGSGHAKQEFAVHGELFKDRFTRHCDPMPNPNTGIVELEGEDPEIVELYIQHLYTGDIPCRQTKFFFILAETLCDETAMHAALQAFIWSFRRLQKVGKPATPSVEIMRYVYSVTRKDSPLRTLFINMYIWEGKYNDSLHLRLPELVTDIAKAATEKWKGRFETDESEYAMCCNYFDSDEKCRSMKRKRGEDDGELVRRRRRARDETPEDEMA